MRDLEKGAAISTHLRGEEFHAMDTKTNASLILHIDTSMKLDPGGEMQWVEAMGRYKITRDH